MIFGSWAEVCLLWRRCSWHYVPLERTSLASRLCANNCCEGSERSCQVGGQLLGEIAKQRILKDKGAEGCGKL